MRITVYMYSTQYTNRGIVYQDRHLRISKDCLQIVKEVTKFRSVHGPHNQFFVHHSNA